MRANVPSMARIDMVAMVVIFELSKRTWMTYASEIGHKIKRAMIQKMTLENPIAARDMLFLNV